MGILSNIVANLAFWILLGATFWLASIVAARRFSLFFGLRRTRSVVVYLSNLWTPESSLRGGTEGYTISLHELWAAESVNKLFGSTPLRLPDLVRGLVDALWLRNPVRCDTLVSPLDPVDADLTRTLIVVGSSVRNTVRARYAMVGLPTALIMGEEDGSPSSGWLDQDQKVRIRDGESPSETVFKGVNLAILEKCHDADRGITVFFCLGARADSSWVAVEYLARTWKNLAREFKGDDFLIFLGLPRTKRYLEEYLEPRRLGSRTI